MKTVIEFSVFLAVATSAHLILWQQAPLGAGAPVGQAGDASITLVASTASLSDMVAVWDRPVDVGTLAVSPPVAPQSPDIAVKVAMPSSNAVPSVNAPAMDMPQPDAMGSDLPGIDTTSAAPRRLATKSSARPTPRPDPVRVAPAPTKKAVKPAAKTSAQKPAKSRDTPKAVAAGAGGGTQAGSKTSRKASSGSGNGNAKALLAQWGGSIRSAIERRKRYPSGTSAKGTVLLAVSVSTNGALASVAVARSSGNPRLDQAAVTAVRRARLRAAPKGVPPGVHRFNLPMAFSR